MNTASKLFFENFPAIAASDGGITKFRELILQLAVQGKLVPQNSKDEPASELLKKIQAKKDLLIKAGKFRNDKPLPEVDDNEIPFGLPAGWKWTRLGVTSHDIHYGYTASADSTKTDVRMLRITDIQDNKVNWQSVPGCDIKKEDIGKYQLSEDNILIARTGGTIGKSYLVKNLSVCGVFASYLIRVIPVSIISAEYCKRFLESPVYWEQLYEKSMGTGQPNVNATSLKGLYFPLPPFAEQKRIVAKVDELMALCDRMEQQLEHVRQRHLQLNESAIHHLLAADSVHKFEKTWKLICEQFKILYDSPENVDKLRQAILQLAVQGKLITQNPNDEPASKLLEKIQAEKERFTSEGRLRKQKVTVAADEKEIPFATPVGWEWCQINAVANKIEYGTSEKASRDSKHVPILRMNNIYKGSIKYGDLKYVPAGISDLPKLYLNHDEILFNRTNSYELVGKSGIFKGESGRYTFASYLIRISLTSCVYADFINHAMNAHYFRETQIEPEITQQCGQANFNGTKLGNCLIPLPPLAEQKRIVAKVDKLMALCDELEDKIRRTRQQTKQLTESIIHHLLISERERLWEV